MEGLNNKPAKLDIGEQLNDAFETYKKMALVGGLAMMCFYLIIMTLIFIGLGFFFNAKELPELIKNFDPDKLSLLGQIKYFSGVVVFVSLISPFMAGILKMARDADNDEKVEFSSMFFYINNPQFVHIVLATATIAIVSNGFNLVIGMLVSKSIATFISLVISLSIGVLTYLAIPLILFKHMNFVNAIKTSIIQISNNLLVTILLMIIAFVFAMLGIIAFCFGALFTIPFMSAMNYSIFKKLNY